LHGFDKSERSFIICETKAGAMLIADEFMHASYRGVAQHFEQSLC